MRKRAQADGYRHALGAYPARQAESRLSDENPAFKAFSIFGHVLGSLQLKVNNTVSGMEAFVYEFQDSVLDFGAKARTEKPVSPHHYRRVERSQKKGFDLLRLTLNLARGNLDEQHPARV